MEIPRGFTPGRAAAAYGAAVGAVSPRSAAAPYAVLASGFGQATAELQQYSLAAQADQELQDRHVAVQTAGKLTSAAKSVSQSLFEQRRVKQPDGTYNDLSDFVDATRPELGTWGEAEFRKQIAVVESNLYATLPKKQRELAQLAGAQVVNSHASQLQDALIGRRGQDRALDGMAGVRQNVADGNYDVARETNLFNRDNRMYTTEAYAALDKEISLQQAQGMLVAFSEKADSGTALTQFFDSIDAINDPNIDNDTKMTLKSSAVALHEKSIVQSDKARSDARRENAVFGMRAIIGGEIQTDAQLAQLNLDAGQMSSLSSFLHRDAEAKDNPVTMRTFARELMDARALSPADQTERVDALAAALDGELERNNISAKSYLAANELLNKLNDPVFNDPYYKEAIVRAAGFLGADVATMAPGATPDDIMRAVFGAQPKVAAALQEFKFSLDPVALTTVPAERAKLLQWTLDNIETYMQTSAGAESASASQVRLWLPDKIDDEGNLKTGETQDSINNEILSDPSLTEQQRRVRINSLDSYLNYQQRLKSLRKAQQAPTTNRLGDSG